MSIRNRVREHGVFSRLRRYPGSGWVAGVCVGLAEFFDWNVKLIRLAFVASFIISGFFPVGVIYLVLWYLMDDASSRPTADDRDSAPSSPPNNGPSPNASELKVRFARLEERLRNMEACVVSRDFELRRELRRLEN